jgi:hypothetical protein
MMEEWKPIAIQQDFGGGMFFSPVPEAHPKIDMLALTKLDMLLQNHFPLTKHI